MLAISMDKHVCLFSIPTVFELENLLRAPYGGQTLGKAGLLSSVIFGLCPMACLQNSPSLLLLSDNQGKILSG